MGNAFSAPEMTLGGAQRRSSVRSGNAATCSSSCHWPTPGRVVPSLSKNGVRIGPGHTARILSLLRRFS